MRNSKVVSLLCQAAMILTVGLFAALLTVGCTKKSKGDYNLKTSETLRINLATEPPTLDWNKATDTTSALIQDNIMEGLVEYNFDDPDLGLLPALATEWKSSKDAKKWTFTIRKGVKWSDGQDFTPQQLVDGWERLLNPNTASEYSYFLYGVKNAKKYNEGKEKDFANVGVKIVGDKVEVELEASQSYFPYLLTHHSTYPVRKDLIAKHGDKWTEAKNMVSLGPYTLKAWDHDKAMVLERNETYYGEKAKIKNVLAYIINEMSTAINLFNTGKLDAQMNLPSTELSALRKRPEFVETGILLMYYYGFNVKKAPMDNPLVRKAVSQAIDRKEITTMLSGGQTPLTSWVPPGMFGYEAGVGVGFDPSKAKALLAKAGYADPSSFPKLTLGFNTNEDHKRVAENIQAQLKRNLGIKVEIKNEEWKVYLSSLKTDPPHIFRMGWVADFPDPDNFLNLMTSYSDNNHTNWGNAEFDKIVNKAVSELDKVKRKQLYSKAQKILTELDVPVAPLYAGVAHMLVSKRVKNYPLNTMWRFQFKKVTLSQ